MELCDSRLCGFFGLGSYGMDAKMVLEWAIKLKSRVINQERMFDNVFDWYSTLWIILECQEGSTKAQIAKERFFWVTLY